MPPLERYIDLHCERLQDGFFQEPFNTLANISFFLVAYLIHRNTANMPKRPALISFFIIIIAVIGAGSTTFHMTARMWGALCDVIPIAIFALVYVFAFGKHVIKGGWIGGFLLMVVYAGTYFGVKTLFLGQPHGRMPDGYVSLIPSVFFLAIITLWLFKIKSISAFNYLKITAIAAIAVSFRTIDLQVCDEFALGTHFLWHMLCAGMLYMMVKEVIRNYHFVRVNV